MKSSKNEVVIAALSDVTAVRKLGAGCLSAHLTAAVYDVSVSETVNRNPAVPHI